MSTIVSFTAVTMNAPASSTRWHQRPVALRLALLTGLLAVAVLAAAVASPSAVMAADPELGWLLRGMALIKASVALAAVALSAWRFGQPVSSRVAVGYLVGAWSLVGATVMIWQLSWIPAAAAIFHVGLFGLLALAWKEGRFDGRRRVPPGSAMSGDVSPGVAGARPAPDCARREERSLLASAHAVKRPRVPADEVAQAT